MAPFQFLKDLHFQRVELAQPSNWRNPGAVTQLQNDVSGERKTLKIDFGFLYIKGCVFCLPFTRWHVRPLFKKKHAWIYQECQPKQTLLFFIQAWQTLEIPGLLAWRSKGAMFFQLPIFVCSSAGQLLLEDVNSFPVECWMMSNRPGSQLWVRKTPGSWISRGMTPVPGWKWCFVYSKFCVDLHLIHPQLLGHLGNGIFLQHWRS